MIKPRLTVLPCQAKGARHDYIASHDQRIYPQINPNIKCQLAISSPIQPFFSPVTLVANRVGCEEYDLQGAGPGRSGTSTAPNPDMYFHASLSCRSTWSPQILYLVCDSRFPRIPRIARTMSLPICRSDDGRQTDHSEPVSFRSRSIRCTFGTSRQALAVTSWAWLFNRVWSAIRNMASRPQKEYGYASVVSHDILSYSCALNC